MPDDGARLKKFLTDQESAVQLARELPDGSNSTRVDAINVALSLASTNAQISGSSVISMSSLLLDAQAAEKYLKGE